MHKKNFEAKGKKMKKVMMLFLLILDLSATAPMNIVNTNANTVIMSAASSASNNSNFSGSGETRSKIIEDILIRLDTLEMHNKFQERFYNLQIKKLKEEVELLKKHK